MVEHIVLIGFKEEASKEQIDQVLAGLVNLKNIIPGIVSLTGGYNSGPSKSDYAIVIAGKFEDQAAFEAYGPHPEHQKVVAYMKEVGLSKILVADYASM